MAIPLGRLVQRLFSDPLRLGTSRKLRDTPDREARRTGRLRPPATSAFLGMALLFLIWSWYFDGVAGASERPVRTRRDAVRFHTWCFAHFPLYLGIILTGVAIQRIVTAAARTARETTNAIVLTTTVAVVMIAMGAIAATTADRQRRRTQAVLRPTFLLAALTLALGVEVHPSSPVVLIVGLAGAELVIALQAGERMIEALAHHLRPRRGHPLLFRGWRVMSHVSGRQRG